MMLLLSICWFWSEAELAVPYVELLRVGNEQERCAAAWTVGRFGGKCKALAVPALAAALTDRAAPVRAAAVQNLQRVVSVPSVNADHFAAVTVSPLVRLLNDEDDAVRTAAEKALQSVACNFPVARFRFMTELAAIADDDKRPRRVRDAALNAARQYMWTYGCPESKFLVPALLKEARDADGKRRYRAFLMLLGTSVATPEVKAVCEAGTADTSAEVRLMAADALARVDPANARVVPTLFALFEDPDHGDSAADSLRRCGDRAKEVLPQLRRYLDGSDDELRRRAIEVLAAIGEPAVAAIPGLIAALQSKSERIRAMSASALGRFGPRSHRAVPALLAAAADQSIDVRRSAMIALGEIGDGRAVPILVEAVVSKRFETLAAAWWALKDIGPPALPALSRISDIVGSPHGLPAAIRIGEPARVAAYSHLLGSADPMDRQFGIRCLERYGPMSKSALPELRKVLHDVFGPLRLQAASAILALDPTDDAVIPMLAIILVQGETSDRIRAASILRGCGKRAVTVREKILFGKFDPNPAVRSLCAAIIAAIEAERN